MAFFDNTDPNFGSLHSILEELNAYPFLNQTSALPYGEVNDQSSAALSYGWGLVGLPEFVIGSSTGLQGMPNHEPVASASLDMTRVNGYDWPAAAQRTQTYHPNFWSQDCFPAGTTASRTYTAPPGPSSVPFVDYPWANQSEPSAGTFYAGNVNTHHQPSAGPTRTGPISAGRFQPYGMFRGRMGERRGVEAGPSTLVPPPALYGGLPAPQPSGWTPETTADAEQHNTITEDNKVATPIRTRYGRARSPLPESQGKRVDAHKMCKWAERHLGLRGFPDFGMALAAAAQFVPTVRPLVYTEPCLHTTTGRRTVVGQSKADREYERRKREQTAYKELSRYYRRKEGENKWTHAGLLSQVVESLENYQPPGTSIRSTGH